MKTLGPVGTRIKFIDSTNLEDFGQLGTIVDHGEGRDIVQWDDGIRSSLYWNDEENRARVEICQEMAV